MPRFPLLLLAIGPILVPHSAKPYVYELSRPTCSVSFQLDSIPDAAVKVVKFEAKGAQPAEIDYILLDPNGRTGRELTIFYVGEYRQTHGFASFGLTTSNVNGNRVSTAAGSKAFLKVTRG